MTTAIALYLGKVTLCTSDEIPCYLQVTRYHADDDYSCKGLYAGLSMTSSFFHYAWLPMTSVSFHYAGLPMTSASLCLIPSNEHSPISLKAFRLIQRPPRMTQSTDTALTGRGEIASTNQNL